jgi:hypothetical protein
MDSDSENKPAENFNQLDLKALQGFQFGVQWTSTGSKNQPEAREGGDRSREDRRTGGFGGTPRKDRRPSHRPRPDADMPGGGGGSEGGESRPPREFRERGHGGRDTGSIRGPRRPDGGFADRAAQQQAQFGYISPHFEVVFYPDDVGFAALIKAMKQSWRTYELFQIANLLLEKNERFVAVIRRTPEGKTTPADGAGSTPEALRKPLFISVPDGLPFENEDSAVRHVVSKHLSNFFDQVEVEVEAPKGNFPFVHKCPRTGELIGPPNHHRYSALLQQHHALHASDMPLEVFRNRLESIREPEVIAAWAEKMRKSIRYVAKFEVDGVRPQFSTREEAVVFLMARQRDQVVKEVGQVRIPGRNFDQLQGGEIRRALDGALQRQRRFPLDTANALRGRLRREGLMLFKLPGKTITYVSAIKPKSRRIGQKFSEAIDSILTIIENRPFIQMAEFERRILNIEPGEAGSTPEYTDAQKEILVKTLHNLRWLVGEGFVVEFADGRLYALPATSSESKSVVDDSGGAGHEDHHQEPDGESLPTDTRGSD